MYWKDPAHCTTGSPKYTLIPKEMFIELFWGGAESFKWSSFKPAKKSTADIRKVYPLRVAVVPGTHWFEPSPWPYLQAWGVYFKPAHGYLLTGQADSLEQEDSLLPLPGSQQPICTRSSRVAVGTGTHLSLSLSLAFRSDSCGFVTRTRSINHTLTMAFHHFY